MKWQKFFKGFGFASNGIRAAFQTQQNMRVHGLIAVCAIALSFILGLQPLEWAVLFLAIGLVIALEMLNTALELTLDVISREHHPQIGLAKDVAAGAVLWAALCCIFVGMGLWGERLGLLLGVF
jgi:diacylglycerol kinase